MKQPKEIPERLQEVLDHIHRNLDSKLSLEELSALASYSPFHFQRIFKSEMGETPKQYVRRVRLEQAAHHIVLHPENALLEVALASGFSSLEAFSRAFKQYYSVSPDEFRKANETEKLALISEKTDSALHSRIEPSAFLSSALADAELENFEVKLQATPRMRLLYIPGRLADPDVILTNLRKVKKWARLRGYCAENAAPLGLMLDYPLFTSLEKCRFHSAVEVDRIPEELPAEMRIMELPARNNAVFHVEGGINGWIRGMTAFATHWLPESGFAIEHVPALMRPLGDPAETHPHELVYEVKIALRSL